nr:MAG TPA: hypothetical protein [Caudoviricetes sp.]
MKTPHQGRNWQRKQECQTVQSEKRLRCFGMKDQS